MPAPTPAEVQYALRGSRILAARYAGQLRRLAYDFDDTCQEAALAVHSARRTFDPNRGATFKTYAWNAVWKRLRDLVKRADRRPVTLPLEVLAETPAEPVDVPIEVGAVFRAARLLPPRQRAVLYYRYAEGLTLRETGDRLGISEKTVSGRCMAGLARLRTLYQD